MPWRIRGARTPRGRRHLESRVVKYMGSKRWMLSNGLGHLLDDRAKNASRFVDLFSGSAAVAWYVAERTQREVVACDLQHYSRVLADAVLQRTAPASSAGIARWISSAGDLIGTN